MKLKTILCALALCCAPLAANAVTVVNAGGSYDINSDNFFAGAAVDPDGGAGSYSVNFFSTSDPTFGAANASVTLRILGTFQNLTMSWVDPTNSANVLGTAPVSSGITSLRTIFTQPNLSQDLVFSWTGSTAGLSFDFDVAAVPVPAGGVLLLTALGGVAALRRRRKAA